jgi:putative SOS response-associated peptidase YedK
MTTAAAPEVAELHPRMPVILPADQIEDWLVYNDANYGQEDNLKHYPVRSFGINDDGEDLIMPVG